MLARLRPVSKKGNSMGISNDRHEWDGEDTVYTANGRPRPTRSGRKTKMQSRRKPKAKRSSASDSAMAKRGIHQRRNKRLTW